MDLAFNQHQYVAADAKPGDEAGCRMSKAATTESPAVPGESDIDNVAVVSNN